MRGDAERAAVVLRNEDGLNGVAVPYAEEPLSRAVGGFLLVNHFGRTNLGEHQELGSEGLGEIGHLVEVAHEVAVHPARKLPGAEGLLADRFAPGLEAGGVEVEKIDACGRLRRAGGGLFALVSGDERFGH